jgi:integrase
MNDAFNSALAPMLEAFVAHKRMLGFKYVKSHIWHLRSLDRYYCENSGDGLLVKTLVEGWIAERTIAVPSQCRSWISVVREFGRYLQSTGQPDAYIVPFGRGPKVQRPTPYLFSKQEVERFFAICDTVTGRRKIKGRHLVMPALFRLMYSCGVRSCEARLLMAQDVVFDEKRIDILGSKGPKDRRLFISEELTGVMADYDRAIAVLFPRREYFFPSPTGSCCSAGSISDNFNRIWDAAGLRQVGGKQPRAYDFRHHFAYANIARWAESGIDVNATLPYLMRYMGHSSLESTYYYIHLAPDFFPVFDKLSKDLEHLLPEVCDEDPQTW